jgi:hypothetical protein
MSGGLVVVGIVVALLVALIVAVKLNDRKNRREAEAVHLQSHLSDTLLRDARFSGLGITPTVHIPMSGSPVRVDVTGEVPAPELRDAAIRVIRAETASLRPDSEVVDRVVVGAWSRRAA